MTPVDLTNWPRKDVFEFYRDFDYPQINICVNIDVTTCTRYLEAQNLSKFKTILWAISHISNSIDELKYRIRNGKNVGTAADDSATPGPTDSANRWFSVAG